MLYLINVSMSCQLDCTVVTGYCVYCVCPVEINWLVDLIKNFPTYLEVFQNETIMLTINHFYDYTCMSYRENYNI